MSEALLDGPRLEPLSGQPARQLVVLVHGYGASGDDLIGLGEVWRARLPEAAFVAPNGPETLPGYGAFGIGYQWFDLTLRDPSEYWRGVSAAGPRLNHFIDAELARRGLQDNQLALVGFSQGTMMALHVGLRRAAPPAAIIANSDTVELATNQRSASAIIQGEIEAALAERNPADAMVVQQPAYLIVQNEIDAATAELDGEIDEQRPTAQIVQDEIDAALAEGAATVETDDLRPAYLIVQDEIDAALAARTETSAN